MLVSLDKEKAESSAKDVVIKELQAKLEAAQASVSNIGSQARSIMAKNQTLNVEMRMLAERDRLRSRHATMRANIASGQPPKSGLATHGSSPLALHGSVVAGLDDQPRPEAPPSTQTPGTLDYTAWNKPESSSTSQQPVETVNPAHLQTQRTANPFARPATSSPAVNRAGIVPLSASSTQAAPTVPTGATAQASSSDETSEQQTSQHASPHWATDNSSPTGSTDEGS